MLEYPYMFGNSQEGHIGTATAFMMIAVAFIFDAVGALLDLLLLGAFMSPVIDFVAAMVFGMWFSANGVSLMSHKRFLGFAATIVVEFFPFINSLPAWTGFIVYSIIKNRAKAAQVSMPGVRLTVPRKYPKAANDTFEIPQAANDNVGPRAGANDEEDDTDIDEEEKKAA